MRRGLVAGTVLFGISSLVGGFAADAPILVGARLAQGLGAALMMPAALSLVTTLFTEGPDRRKALGIWGGVAGLASAAGVLLGGVLTEGPGWRWVLFVNPPICLLVLAATFWLIPGQRRAARRAGFDGLGTVLGTGGMLLLVYALVKAPGQGWGSARTIGEFAVVFALLAAFVLNEQRSKHPLVPLSIFKTRGLAAADITQLIGVGGFVTMFFFLTLYMQNVLGYSPLQAGASYLPLTVGVGIAAGIATQLIGRIGTRPVIVAGALITAAGLYWLSRIPVHGSYLTNLLPGLMIVSLGIGGVFVATTTAANAGVPKALAGLAAALLNASQQIGAAIGLAIFSAIATSYTSHLLAAGHSPASALTAGFHRALLAAAIFLLAAALIALRTRNARSLTPNRNPDPSPDQSPRLSLCQPPCDERTTNGPHSGAFGPVARPASDPGRQGSHPGPAAAGQPDRPRAPAHTAAVPGRGQPADHRVRRGPPVRAALRRPGRLHPPRQHLADRHIIPLGPQPAHRPAGRYSPQGQAPTSRRRGLHRRSPRGRALRHHGPRQPRLRQVQPDRPRPGRQPQPRRPSPGLGCWRPSHPADAALIESPQTEPPMRQGQRARPAPRTHHQDTPAQWQRGKRNLRAHKFGHPCRRLRTSTVLQVAASARRIAAGTAAIRVTYSSAATYIGTVLSIACAPSPSPACSACRSAVPTIRSPFRCASSSSRTRPACRSFSHTFAASHSAALSASATEHSRNPKYLRTSAR